MNLEERIESAWKEHWNSSGLHAGESFTDFRAGYLAAIQKSIELDLDERIEAAWKEHMSRRYYPTERETDDAQDEFTAGYRAAMRSLYVEVKPEHRLRAVVYDCETRDGKWVRLRYFGNDELYWDIDKESQVQYEDVVRTFLPADIPSPAEIFGDTK